MNKNLDTDRADFEKVYLELNPTHSIARAKDGGYQQSGCELAWAAYRRALKFFRLHIGQKEKRKAKGDLFFIGGYAKNSEDKNFSFATRPHFHKKIEIAEAEAQRLANTRGGKYIVFGRVSESFTPQPNAIDVHTGNAVLVVETNPDIHKDFERDYTNVWVSDTPLNRNPTIDLPIASQIPPPLELK